MDTDSRIRQLSSLLLLVDRRALYARKTVKITSIAGKNISFFLIQKSNGTAHFQGSANQCVKRNKNSLSITLTNVGTSIAVSLMSASDIHRNFVDSPQYRWAFGPTGVIKHPFNGATRQVCAGSCAIVWRNTYQAGRRALYP